MINKNTYFYCHFSKQICNARLFNTDILGSELFLKNCIALQSSFPDAYFRTIVGPYFIYSATVILRMEELMEAITEKGKGVFIFWNNKRVLVLNSAEIKR